MLASELDLSAAKLDLAALDLAFQPALLRAVCRLGRPPLAGHHRQAINQRLQTAQGLFPVLLLTAVFLRLDDQYTFLGNPLVIEMQQTLLDRFRQGRGGNIEAQVNRAGHLVDVLAPGPLRTHGGDFNLAEWNLDRAGV